MFFLMKRLASCCVGFSFLVVQFALGQTVEEKLEALELQLRESREITNRLAEQLDALKAQTGKGLSPSGTLSGYISSSFRYTPTSYVGNDLYKFSGGSDRRDRFALDVVALNWLHQNNNAPWKAGFNFQTWIGPDADLLKTSDSTDTEIAIKQAYINLHFPVGDGLGFKAGVFDTVIGYESTDRNNNPFHSHSWGKSIEPTQHTGFLFDYKLTENLKLYAGVANSTSPKINGLSDNDNRFTLIGAADYMVPEEFWGLGGSTFTLGTVNGRPWDQGNNGLVPIREEYYYFGGRIPTPWEDLTLGVAWDLKRTEGGGNDDQVLGGYLSYRATDILELNLRGEKFEAGNGLGSSMSDGWGVTSGFTYQLWNNTKARFEYRYDRTDLPVGGKNGNNTLIWNLIYSF